MEWVRDDGTATRILDDLIAELDSRGPKPLPHMTELIYCLTYSYYKRYAGVQPSRDASMIFLVGVGLETALLRPHKVHQSGVYEGIHYEADFLDYNNNIGELKSTRLSANKGPDELPQTWMRQILGYMKVMGKTEATLAIIHLMGNYRPPFPQLVTWHGTAKQEEIDQNWEWLQYRKGVYKEYIRREEAPTEFTYNEPWECDNCIAKVICEARRLAREGAK